MKSWHVAAGLVAFVLGLTLFLNLGNIFYGGRSAWPLFPSMLLELITTMLIFGGLIMLREGSEFKGGVWFGWIISIIIIISIIAILSALGAFSPRAL